MKISAITTDEIKQELEELKNITSSISSQVKKGDDKLLNFNQAADYLGCSHSYLYKLTSKKIIPYHKPIWHLFFFKHELDAWIKRNDKNEEPTETDNDESNNKLIEEEDPP